MHSFRFVPIVLVPLSLILASCDRADGGAPAAYPAPTVKAVVIAAADVPVEQDYPGRIVATRLAEVRARVTGIVLAREFTEGADVKAGDVLFHIDPARFQAAADAARAQLARAEAALDLAKQQEVRAGDLLKKKVASKDQYDTALASRRQAEAEVGVARANLQTADLDLSYATVRAPIAGRIDAALVTEGAFVRQEDGTQMAIVRELSSVYVDFTAPLEDVLDIQRVADVEPSGKAGRNMAVQLIGRDGEVYDQPGHLLFSAAVVNETTGQVSLRAEFANPQGRLLPGAYVRVKLRQKTVQQALLVPQRAVQWDTLGQAHVMIVKDGKAVVQPIVTNLAIENRWLVTNGLKPGDQVIVDGAEKTMPGGPVTAELIKDESGPDAALETGCAASCAKQAKL
ncbi:hypothetical protein BJF93_09065 [Xaviernesmea oryzae]|uniref:Uncharacterized protein n=1 Tax=Xaviernesmea oryzae TaxID=464029 RepID=A0A1Q9AU03_9HYPH|nr:efflux RND transporter periplasmic adaptor subunit [Xaviernesmea oryzae]OLP58830.1 hypothetical protein BJF93_09065 [Xaviernesmea oryzae]SEM10800.1 membrane fusion protein, multidrug efflux system [Xaviernesmea oryzae]